MICTSSQLLVVFYTLYVVTAIMSPRSPVRSSNQSPEDMEFISKLDKENDAASKILASILTSKSGWTHVNTKDGVTVEKRFLPAQDFVSVEDRKKGGKHACVKSSGIINSSPESVYELFCDNSRVNEYNEHCIKMIDVLQFGGGRGKGGGGKKSNGVETWSKITWASGPKYGPFKPRDFLSVVYFQKFSNGTSIVLNRPAYQSKFATTTKSNDDEEGGGAKYVRATILLAGNVIEPHGEHGEKTLLTQVAHINPGGGADTPAVAWIINKVCAFGPPAFFRKLEAAAQKSDAMALRKRMKRQQQQKLNFIIPSLSRGQEAFKGMQAWYREGREGAKHEWNRMMNGGKKRKGGDSIDNVSDGKRVAVVGSVSKR